MLGGLESDFSQFKEAKESDGFSEPLRGNKSGAFKELSGSVARYREYFALEPV